MIWEQPLIRAQFLKRYKRFFADVELDGQVLTAHVPNTGSLLSVNVSGQPCYLSPASNPDRKLKFTLEAIQAPNGAWVGVNTSWPNRLVKEAFLQKKIPHWRDFDEFQGEVKISQSTRLDACLIKKNPFRQHYIEVKNVTLARDQVAQFPDAVTERGQKHLTELMRLKNEGHEVEIVFVIQRSDVVAFSPAEDIDPTYAQLLRQAHAQGVIITPLQAIVDSQGIELKPDVMRLQL